jgi:ssDNA-binding Zn-finger/Zn-ribbon topoisomerase 1
MKPMNKLFFVLMFLTGLNVSAQKIRIKVNGQKDTVVNLIKYYGQKLYYADTAEMKNGEVIFDGKKQKPGIVGLFLPGQRYFEFIYNNEDVQLETTGPDFMVNMKVKKSEENKVFVPYVNFISNRKTEANKLGEQRNKLKKEDPEFKTLSDKIDAINKEVEAYQKNLVEQNKGKLVSKIVKMSMEIEIPEPRKIKMTASLTKILNLNTTVHIIGTTLIFLMTLWSTIQFFTISLNFISVKT